MTYYATRNGLKRKRFFRFEIVDGIKYNESLESLSMLVALINQNMISKREQKADIEIYSHFVDFI